MKRLLIALTLAGFLMAGIPAATNIPGVATVAEAGGCLGSSGKKKTGNQKPPKFNNQSNDCKKNND
jgi:hypothetical protein